MIPNKKKLHLAGILSGLFGLMALVVVLGVIKFFKGNIQKDKVKSQVHSLKSVKTQMRKSPPPPKPKPKKISKKIEALKPIVKSSLSMAGSSFGLSTDFMSDLDKALGGDDELIMDDSLVDKKPEPLSQGSFEFPDAASEAGIHKGNVLLRMLVGIDGRVERVKVMQALPEGYFDEPAVTIVKQWKFKPAEYKGRAVAVWVNQAIAFGE